MYIYGIATTTTPKHHAPIYTYDTNHHPKIQPPNTQQAAVEAAADALSTLGGRIFLFTASRPTRGAGALRLRADPRSVIFKIDCVVVLRVNRIRRATNQLPYAHMCVRE